MQPQPPPVSDRSSHRPWPLGLPPAALLFRALTLLFRRCFLVSLSAGLLFPYSWPFPSGTLPTAFPHFAPSLARPSSTPRLLLGMASVSPLAATAGAPLRYHRLPCFPAGQPATPRHTASAGSLAVLPPPAPLMLLCLLCSCQRRRLHLLSLPPPEVWCFSPVVLQSFGAPSPFLHRRTDSHCISSLCKLAFRMLSRTRHTGASRTTRMLSVLPPYSSSSCGLRLLPSLRPAPLLPHRICICMCRSCCSCIACTLPHALGTWAHCTVRTQLPLVDRTRHSTASPAVLHPFVATFFAGGAP